MLIGTGAHIISTSIGSVRWALVIGAVVTIVSLQEARSEHHTSLPQQDRTDSSIEFPALSFAIIVAARIIVFLAPTDS